MQYISDSEKEEGYEKFKHIKNIDESYDDFKNFDFSSKVSDK